MTRRSGVFIRRRGGGDAPRPEEEEEEELSGAETCRSPAPRRRPALTAAEASPSPPVNPTMLHLRLRLPAGGAAALLLALLSGWSAQGASLPRHHRLRGGDGEAPPAAFPPNSDMMKALEYIENLKQQRNGGGGGRDEPVDYDEVDKFRVLLQLAARQDDGASDGKPQVFAPRPDVSTEQLVKALLKTLQDQVGRTAQSAPAPAAAAEPSRNDRRAYRHRTAGAAGLVPGPAGPASPPSEFGNFPRPHKKYPLMFEDEENRDAYRRATEDLEEQYTPQSLANLRSIFEELGRMPSTAGQRRDLAADRHQEEEEEMFNPRNLAYEDVAGGEDWLPMEEREETEEVENRSHEEFDRGLRGSEESEESEEVLQRRASPNQEDSDDDTKLVDYYLLKVLEMSDQTQKRDQTGEQKKRLIRPSILDPRTLKELLALSLKLHVPPQDLIDTLITEELRKLHRHPQPPPPYRPGQTPKIRYYSRRLPLKTQSPPEDMDREDFLDIIGVETISNEYPVIQRPAKPVSSLDKVPVQSVSAANSAPAPPKVSSPSGRRENLFLSELNKMPLKRQTDAADADDDDDVEDEVTTYLAAKILTEYPNGISKRDTQAQRRGQLPYQLYEQAVKDYLGQVDTDKVAKRDLEGEQEESARPTETQQGGEEALDETSAPQTVNPEEKPRGKPVVGM